MNHLSTKVVALGLASIMAVAPAISLAQTSSSRHRQQQKNQWRNVGYAAAAVGVLGLLKKDKTMAAAGLLGAGYSAYRYEQDRKSQARLDGRYRGDYRYRDSDRYGYVRDRNFGTTRASRYDRDEDERGSYRFDGRGRPHRDNGKHKGWYKNGKR